MSFILGAVTTNHWESIADSLKIFFFALAIFWVMVSWIARGSSGKEDAFELFKFMMYIMLVFVGVYYYPILLDKLFEMTTSYQQGFRNMSDDLRSALYVVDVGGLMMGDLGQFSLLFGSGLCDTAMTYMVIFFELAKGIMVILCPLLISFVLHKSTEAVGIKFITLSVCLGMIPIGVAFADYMGLMLTEYVLKDSDNSCEQHLYKLAAGIEGYNENKLDGMSYSAAFWLAVTQVICGATAFYSPILIKQIFSGVGPWVAALSAGKSAGQAVATAAGGGGKAAAALAGNPGVQRAARAGMLGAMGMGSKIGKMIGGMSGGKSPQSAKGRSVNNHR